MKLLFCVFALIGTIHAQYLVSPTPWTEAYKFRNVEPIFEVPCNFNITSEVVLNFQNAVFEAVTTIFKKTEMLSNAHFSFSPLTMWQTMAAIAEGSEGETKQQLFRFLGLPEDRCVRQMYYYLASTREPAGDDVVLDRKRLFIADSSVILDGQWENFVTSQRLIDVLSLPFKSDPVAYIQSWQQAFNTELYNLNLNGNSVILESLDYNGLWTSAFSDATIVSGPFYNRFGQQIGSMEYMKIQKVVNMTYLPDLKIKIMELPVGYNGRYRMLFALPTEQTGPTSNIEDLKKSNVFEAFNSLRSSVEPIEVVIPRVTIISETDIRIILEQIGFKGLWADPYATSKISAPAALPSSFIQRTTLTLDYKTLGHNTLDSTYPVAFYSALFKRSNPSKRSSNETELDLAAEQGSNSSNETDLDPAVEQDSDSSIETDLDPAVEQARDSSIETEQDPDAGQTRDPSTTTEQNQFVGQTRDPSIATAQDPAVGQSRGPNIETEQNRFVGQTRDPSIATAQDPAVGQARDPSIGALDPTVGQDFIANRPFLFALFDSETLMCVFASSYSKPN